MELVPIPEPVAQRIPGVLEKAHAPYSKFRVGCLLGDQDRNLFAGANIENASYGAVLCAERVALSQWRMGASAPIESIYLFHNGTQTIFPCGVCLQTLSEFVRECDFYLWDPGAAAFRKMTFSELFPYRFSGKTLEHA